MTKINRLELPSDIPPSFLILVAAGSSSRMGLGIKKEYLPLKGGTVLSSAASAFLESLPFSALAVTYPHFDNPQEDLESKQACKKALDSDPAFRDSKVPLLLVSGGSTRQESVLKALQTLQESNPQVKDSFVFIHDGARPFVTKETILRCAQAAFEYGASVPALQPVDTQNEVDDQGFITRHLIRSSLVAVQTPQVFAFAPLLEAHKKAAEKGVACTDDTEIWDSFVAENIRDKKGLPYHRVKVVEGDSSNKKITYASDLQTLGLSAESSKEKNMIHTGLGYDKHRLVEGRRLMLGGVEIPSEKGEDGHSDGDVLLHAITDALLGAAALGDIGSYFPPSDPKWKDADSKVLLSKCWSDVKAEGWSLSNLDCVIALEKPKFLPHRDKVRASIADILGVSVDQVFVKAKTGEKTGDVGEGRVIESWVSCLLEK